MRGRVCTSADLTREPVWRGVARRLAEWHAVLPVVSARPEQEVGNQALQPGISAGHGAGKQLHASHGITPGKTTPNIWTVMQRWTHALPTTTEAERQRKDSLQKELERLVEEFGNLPGLGSDGVGVIHSVH